MSDTAYCYHCSRHHPKQEMRLIQTRAGRRWRCRKSILATRRSVAERDAYGRQVTADNSALQSMRSQVVARELRGH